MKYATLIIDGIKYDYYDKEYGEIIVRVGDNGNIKQNAFWDIDILTEDLYTQDNLEIVFINDDVLDYQINENSIYYLDEEKYKDFHNRLIAFKERKKTDVLY